MQQKYDRHFKKTKPQTESNYPEDTESKQQKRNSTHSRAMEAKRDSFLQFDSRNGVAQTNSEAKLLEKVKSNGQKLRDSLE